MPRSSGFRALVLAVVALSLSACSNDGDGQSIWAADLEVGDCADPVLPSPDSDRPNGLTRVHRVDCAGEHFLEVYGQVWYPGSVVPGSGPSPTTGYPQGPYPGESAFKRYAGNACAQPFRAYLGRTPRAPSMILTYLYPSSASWLDAAADRPDLGPLQRILGPKPPTNRYVFCVVRSRGPAKLVGSLRGSPYPTATPTGTGPVPSP